MPSKLLVTDCLNIAHKVEGFRHSEGKYTREIGNSVNKSMSLVPYKILLILYKIYSQHFMFKASVHDFGGTDAPTIEP